MEAYEYIATLLKALAHPVRLQIIDSLDRDGEACVCHLENRLDKRQAYISQHLAKLREVGLVQYRREGMNVFYSLSAALTMDDLAAIRSLAVSMAAAEGQTIEFQPLKRVVDEPCPCPRCDEPVGTRAEPPSNLEIAHDGG